jgi:uncharacterized protein (TIGR02453 family)
MADQTRFTGFPPEAIGFLVDLAANNDRAWFTPRKAQFETLLKQPLDALCSTLAERFEARGIGLTADRHSPFRIYRDTRFSKDKSPYKTAVSAQFPVAGVPGGPGGYFHLEPGEIVTGGGLYRPPTPVLVAWRRLVDAEPDVVHAALDDPGFTALFGRLYAEEELARVPAGYARDHADGDLLRLKDLIFTRRLSDADVLSPDLPDILCDGFEAAAPVFALLGRVAADAADARSAGGTGAPSGSA